MLNNVSGLGKLVYYDYSALIVLSVILISTVMRKMTKGRLNTIFILIVVTAFASTLCDCLAVRHDNNLYSNTTVRMAEHMAYLFFHVLTTPLFCLYVTELTDTRHLVRRRRLLVYLLAVPFFAATAAILLTPVNHKMFYFDSSLQYVRGQWFWLLYFSAVFYVAYLIFFLVRFRRGHKGQVGVTCDTACVYACGYRFAVFLPGVSGGDVCYGCRAFVYFRYGAKARGDNRRRIGR